MKRGGVALAFVAQGVFEVRDGGQILGDGDEVETLIDEAVLAGYRNSLDVFKAGLRQRLTGRGGRFFSLSSNADISRFFLRDLRAAGVLL